MKKRLLVAAFPLLFAGCGDDTSSTESPTSAASSAASTATASTSSGTGGGGGGPERPPATPDPERDILSSAITLDIGTLEGQVTLLLAPSDSQGATFEIGDLTISAVRDDDGDLLYEAHDGLLDVGVPTSAQPSTVIVDYTFKAHDAFDGWMPSMGVSFLWPYFCGNLFPCKSDPADGMSFALTVTGVPAGLSAVVPPPVVTAAPSYMPALAVGEYTEKELGTTPQGTEVSVFYLPGGESDALAGTAHLLEVVDFYETTYGPYAFGTKMASVAADWGPGDFGGMEHHPYFHVGTGGMSIEEVHAHEAAHGWFGDGVRIRCWEDFVLSEGTVTYMAARALESAGVDIWPSYGCDLEYACVTEQTIALPDTCGAIDILNDPLWSLTPYMKGAYFYRDVAAVIGKDVLDQVLSAFYQGNVGNAAHMTDLLAAIEAAADPADVATLQDLEQSWLREVACPIDVASLCP